MLGIQPLKYYYFLLTLVSLEV